MIEKFTEEQLVKSPYEDNEAREKINELVDAVNALSPAPKTQAKAPAKEPAKES